MVLKRERGSNKSKGLCKLAIEENMTIYVIDELKQGLSEQIASYDRFELNLGKVEEIDSAGIQLLLALKRELVQKDKRFELTQVSGAVAKLLEAYNLGDHFTTGAGA